MNRRGRPLLAIAACMITVVVATKGCTSEVAAGRGRHYELEIDKMGTLLGVGSSFDSGQMGAARPLTSIPVSILIYKPHLDTGDRLRGLGYDVTDTFDAFDLTRSNLQNYDVLWIDAGNGVQWNPTLRAEIQPWVAEDGAGLVFTQPDDAGKVELFPPGFEVTVYDDGWPGWPGSGGHAVIVDGSHPITTGLGDMDIAGNGDWVWKDDTGPSWDILGVDELLPDDVVALLAGEYDEGRMVFNTGNYSSQSSDPGTDQYVIQLLTWLSQKEPPPQPCSAAATVGATPSSSMLNHLAFLLAPLAVVLVLRRGKTLWMP